MAEKKELAVTEEKIVEIEMERLRSFENHPFKVKADSQMIELQESVKKYGILNPLIVRPKKDGTYEIISGHRRKFAAEKIGYRKVPVIIRVLKDDDAVVSMVDSNLQREMISPSEKAFAYKMKYEVIKRRAGRRKCGQVDHNLGKKSIELIGEECGDSPKQVQRYIKITDLIPEMLEKVDDGSMGFTPAVQLSYLNKKEQREMLEAMEFAQCTPSLSQALRIEMLIYQATKRVSQYVLNDEKEFVEQLKAQYEIQCEKDNTNDKRELLEAKRRMMDLDDLIKGLYENFTLGRLPERQFNRLMTEYDTEQSNLEQRISELETATERISTKAVQIDKFVRLVKKYRDFEELTTPMLNDFIEKVVIHEAEGGRTKDRTQQVDIYFNFIGNFVLPLSEDEVESLQLEEARREEEIAERKRNSSKKSTQKRNQKRAEIKAKAEAGDPEAMAKYEAILEKGRQNNRKQAEKMRKLRMADPEYRAKMEEKERLALERERKRQERATRKKKIALAELKEQAEQGNQEAIRELEERRAIARERSRKSAEKRKLRAENDPEYAKYLEERNAEYNRRHTARRMEQLDALKARAEAGDQEAQSQLAEHKQYQVRATVKSYRKMRDDALNGDPIAKERYEKTLAKRREAYHAKKNEQSA